MQSKRKLRNFNKTKPFSILYVASVLLVLVLATLIYVNI